MFSFLKRNNHIEDALDMMRRCYFLKDKEIRGLKERLKKGELEKEKLELSKKYALKSLIDEDMTGYVKLGNKLLKVKVERAEKCWGPEGFDFKEIDLECIGEEYD